MCEGLPDRALLRCLGAKSVKDGRHKSGVLKTLTKSEGLIGMVDEDPKNTQSRPKAMREFRLVEARHGTKLYYHKSNNNKLIILCPDLESWVLKTTKTSKINIGEYGLPKTPSALHRIINTRLANFEKLIVQLIKLQNPSILYLQSLFIL